MIKIKSISRKIKILETQKIMIKVKAKENKLKNNPDQFQELKNLREEEDLKLST